MKFLREHKKLHIWLGVTVLILVLFLLFRDNRTVMTFWVDNVTWRIVPVLQWLTQWMPFSVAEVMIVAVFLLPIILLIRAIVRMCRRRMSVGYGLYRIVVGGFAMALTVLAAFSLFWGANYYADNFQTRAGITARGGTVDDLERVTRIFAEGLNETAHLVERDADGVFAVSIEQIFGESVYAFSGIEEAFPFLAHRDVRPKPLVSSPLWAMTSYTGFYFPFTGEANINILAPRSQIPATVLHEFAHQRGIASENEANFIAILAGIKSDNPIFAYSSWMMGYLYLSNALHRASPERHRAIQETLPAYVFADFADIRAYRERRHEVVAQVMDNLNDAMLQGYGVESGIRSYGEVVDLLIVYF